VTVYVSEAEFLTPAAEHNVKAIKFEVVVDAEDMEIMRAICEDGTLMAAGGSLQDGANRCRELAVKAIREYIDMGGRKYPVKNKPSILVSDLNDMIKECEDEAGESLDTRRIFAGLGRLMDKAVKEGE